MTAIDETYNERLPLTSRVSQHLTTFYLTAARFGS
jgi:hypothetical protein